RVYVGHRAPGRARGRALGSHGHADATGNGYRPVHSPRSARDARGPRTARRRLERGFGTPRGAAWRRRPRHIAEGRTGMKRYTLALLAYLVPTFALGFVWHLVLFASYYDALGIYRRDIIIPFGFLSMFIQAAIFARIYEKSFATASGPLWARGVRY